MKFAHSAGWMLLMLASGGVYGQQAANQQAGGTGLAKKGAAVMEAQQEGGGQEPGRHAAAEDNKSIERAKTLRDADELIKNGKPAEAYALLAPHQSDLAGDPEYDYLLGIAALDSGRPNEAVFALERVLAVNPNHLQARAEIARAYYATGEMAASQREFETVKKQNAPREVNAAIEKYLDAIEQARAAERTTVRGYVAAGGGYDTNVNSATAANQIAIPVFGGAIATLSANGVRQHDTFSNIGGGVSVRHPFTPEWAMFAGASYGQRFNSSKAASIFDTGALDGNVGLNLLKGADSYSAALQFQNFDVDNNRYRNAAGMTAQWLHNLDGNNQVSAYLQYTDLRYPAQDIRNARRYILGAAYAWALGGSYTPVVYLSGYGGRENERQSGVPYLGHNPYGLRAGGEMRLTQEATLFGSMNFEWRNYHGPDPLFLTTRKDTQADLSMGIGYVPIREWTITTSLSYTRNRSNIVINDYNRAMFSVSVRRDFD